VCLVGGSPGNPWVWRAVHGGIGADPVAARPYASYTIARMEQLASASDDDPEVLERLLAELEHRTVPRARRLRSRLERTVGVSKGAPLPPVTKRGASAETDGTEATAAEVASAEFESLRQTYELLRATFTVEAEVLARWGMTSAMPQDLQELVFGEWMKRLSEEPDEAARSTWTLQEDRLHVRRERVALQNAATRLPGPVRHRDGN